MRKKLRKFLSLDKRYLFEATYLDYGDDDTV